MTTSTPAAILKALEVIGEYAAVDQLSPRRLNRPERCVFAVGVGDALETHAPAASAPWGAIANLAPGAPCAQSAAGADARPADTS